MSSPPLVVFLFLSAQTGETAPGDLITNLAPPPPCGMCHSNTEKTLAYDTYRGTPMFLASVDPVFLAAQELAVEDDIEVAALCIKCHFPTGWLAGRNLPEDGSGLSVGDKHGLSCDFCHRLLPPPEPQATTDGGVLADGGQTDGGVTPPPGLPVENGLFFMHDGNIKYGPFDDPADTVNHESAQSDYIHQSAMCGQCHNVTNPNKERKDPATGDSLGYAMPEQRTYTEWLRSDFANLDTDTGKTCQDCHMADFVGQSSNQGNVPERTLASHRIVGGNPVLPRLVAALPGGPGVPDYVSGIDDDAELAALESERLLQEESADFEAVSASISANSVTVRVTNKTGHKLPTGYAEGRRMWLAHNVTYGDNTTGPQSGQVDASGYLDSDALPLETWEILLGDADNNLTFRFLLADRILKDNRIPPLGFRPTADTAPVDGDYPALANGTLPAFDEVTLPMGTPPCYPVRIQAELFYQPITPGYQAFLSATASDNGERLADAWAAIGAGQPIQMNTIDVHVSENGDIVPAMGQPAVCTPIMPVNDAGTMDAAVPEMPDAGDAPEPEPSEPAPQPEPEPETGDDDGCNCSTSADGSAPLSFGALLVTGLLAARRRRTRAA